MPEIKLKIRLVDKKKIFPLDAKYTPENRLAQVKRGLRQQFPTRFEINPDHIYQEIAGHGTQYVTFVDNVTRKSVEVEKVKVREIKEDGKKHVETETVTESIEAGESHALTTKDGDVDGKKKNTLDYLVEEKFWKSLIAKAKLPLSTVLIILFAGGGIFYVIKEIVLPIFGVT